MHPATPILPFALALAVSTGAFASAATRVENESGAKPVADPCGRERLQALREQFDSEHLLRAARDPTRWIEHDRAFLRESAAWLEQCPDQIPLRIRRMRTLAALPGAGAEEVSREVDGFLRACEGRRDPSCTATASLLSAVEILAFWRAGIDAAAALLERVRRDTATKGLSCSETWREVCWQLVRAELRLALARGDCRPASEALQRLQSELPVRESDPEIPGSQGEIEGREVADLLGLRGEVAATCGSKPEARALYVAARAAGDVDRMRQRLALAALSEDGAAPGAGDRPGVARVDQAGRSSALVSALPVTRIDWERVDQPLPGQALVDFEGQRWRLTDPGAKAVLLNFWATWCAPCRTELYFVQALHERARALPGLLVLTVNLDDDSALASKFVTQRGFTFPVLMGKEAFPRELEEGLPLTWVADASGRVVRRMFGFATDGRIDWVGGALQELRQIAGLARPEIAPTEDQGPVARGLQEGRLGLWSRSPRGLAFRRWLDRRALVLARRQWRSRFSSSRCSRAAAFRPKAS